MRVNKYEVELDNGKKMTFSSATSEAEAQRFAERGLSEGRARYEGASSVKSVRLVKRGIWG